MHSCLHMQHVLRATVHVSLMDWGDLLTDLRFFWRVVLTSTTITFGDVERTCEHPYLDLACAMLIASASAENWATDPRVNWRGRVASVLCIRWCVSPSPAARHRPTGACANCVDSQPTFRIGSTCSSKWRFFCLFHWHNITRGSYYVRSVIFFVSIDFVSA